MNKLGIFVILSIVFGVVQTVNAQNGNLDMELEVTDEEKQRKMIHYISEKFIENPDDRWPFMTHAVYIAKHRIKDMQLALKCAQLIRQYAKDDNIPYWAKQMEIFVLEDMGELESAMVIIGGLLESGELKDPHQRKFLGQRLDEIKLRQKESN